MVRQELCDLLWGDSPRENVRLNLRNAIYVISKATSKELFDKGTNKTKIGFSDNVEVITDLKYFDRQKKGKTYPTKDILSFYQKEFLTALDLSDKGIEESLDLNELLQSNREKYKNEYKELLNTLYASMLKDNKENQDFRGEGSMDDKMVILSKILEVDPTSEATALELIKIYTEKRRFTEATDIYKQYQKNLKNILDMESGNQFKDTFKRLLDQKPFELKTDVIYPLFSRDGIMNVIKKSITMFSSEELTPSLLIKGVPGTGKTRLIHEIDEISGLEDQVARLIMVKIY